MKSIYKYMIIGISAFVLFMLSNIGESNFAFGARLPNLESSGTVTVPERSAGAGKPSISERAMIFREHHITDPGMNNIVASTVLVPEGWTVEGGITRPAPQFYSMPVVLDIKFIAPDGRQARQFPSFRFEFNHQQTSALFSPTLDGHMYMDLPESPGAWLMEMNRIHPDPNISDLRLISEQMDPEMTRKLREQNAQVYRRIAQNRPTAMQIGFATEFDTQATDLVGI